MRPLVSGSEAKRYEEPATDTWLLFPYEPDAAGRVRLIDQAGLEARFPKAWTYLRSWKSQLCGRESKESQGQRIAPFDDAQWYRFGRNQNIDKQERAKLIVAQTVPAMRVCMDTSGDKYLNNVRVNGILAPTDEGLPFLLGVLNGPVADYVFRRIGKPKDAGWFEANKQFIAPLPVPRASAEEQAEVGRRALRLQQEITRHCDLAKAAAERLAVLARARHGEAWLWPDLPELQALEGESPAKLRLARDRRAWADERLAEAIEARHAALQAHLDRDAPLEVSFADGELRLLAGGAVALRGVFLDPEDGALTKAWWRWLLQGARPTDVASLAADLRRPPVGAPAPAARQFVEKIAEMEAATKAIATEEAAMNDLLFDLYALTGEERELVRRG